MSDHPLRHFDGFIFDLDGTLYLGNMPLPHAAEAVALVRSMDKKVAFLTNSTLHHRRFYADKLTRLGIPATVADVMTSACGTALWLRKKCRQRPSTAFVVGEEGLVEELAEVGVETRSEWPVEFVVAALDRQFTYQKLLSAQRAIFRGAVFVATNADPVFPTEKGLVPGAGSIVSAITCATGVKPKVIGKPRPFLVREILERLGMHPYQCVLVGDSPNSDVVAARAAAVKSALVLTGTCHDTELKGARARTHADFILDDLAHFCRLMGQD